MSAPIVLLSSSPARPPLIKSTPPKQQTKVQNIFTSSPCFDTSSPNPRLSGSRTRGQAAGGEMIFKNIERSTEEDDFSFAPTPAKKRTYHYQKYTVAVDQTQLDSIDPSSSTSKKRRRHEKPDTMCIDLSEDLIECIVPEPSKQTTTKPAAIKNKDSSVPQVEQTLEQPTDSYASGRARTKTTRVKNTAKPKTKTTFPDEIMNSSQDDLISYNRNRQGGQNLELSQTSAKAPATKKGKKGLTEEETAQLLQAKALAQTNKRLTKEAMVMEMRVTLSISLSIESFLQLAHENGVVLVRSSLGLPSALEGMVFERLITRRWDEERSCFLPQPVPHLYGHENYIAFMLNPEKFLDVQSDIVNIIRDIKIRYPGKKQIWFLTGMTAHLKKLKNARNREWRKRVLDATGATPLEESAEENTAAIVARAITMLQLEGCNVIECKDQEDRDEFLMRCIREIAYAPEEHRLDSHSFNFGLDCTGIKSGASYTEHWENMLAQLSLMTANSAREVVKAYPTVQSLLNAIVSKQERLADIVISSNTTTNTRKLGPAMAKRIVKMMTETDPEAVIK